MTKINHSLRHKMEQLKVWQEEAKLCLMVVAAVSAVAVFFINLFHGKVTMPSVGDVVEDIKGLGTSTSTQASATKFLAVIPHPVVHHMHVPIFLYINFAVIVLLVLLVLYFSIVVMKKWGKKK